MLARLGKAGPALVHHMVVGEGNDFDAVGLERVEQCNRRVELKWLGALRVRRSHRGFEVDEAEVGPPEDVAHVREERAPALSAFSGSGCRGADRFVRNHVASHGKADLGQLVRIWNDDGCCVVTVKAGQKDCCNRRKGQKNAAGQTPLPAQRGHEPCAPSRPTRPMVSQRQSRPLPGCMMERNQDTGLAGPGLPIMGQFEKAIPQRLKPTFIFIALTARLKLCPARSPRFSSVCQSHPLRALHSPFASIPYEKSGRELVP